MIKILEVGTIELTKKDLRENIICKILSEAIFDLFSFELNEPRILTNGKMKNKLIENLKVNTEIGNLENIEFEKFCEAVHYLEFDLGLYFIETKDKVNIIFISGSGKKISLVKWSVIEKKLKNSENILKKHEKNDKNNEKIKKIKIKNEKNNICTNMQKQIQKQKLNDFLSENLI